MIIDVRTSNEFDEDMVDGAVNLPLQDIMNGVLPSCDKDESIILHCRSGARAESAKAMLASAGFSNIVNVGGSDACRRHLNENEV